MLSGAALRMVSGVGVGVSRSGGVAAKTILESRVLDCMGQDRVTGWSCGTALVAVFFTNWSAMPKS